MNTADVIKKANWSKSIHRFCPICNKLRDMRPEFEDYTGMKTYICDYCGRYHVTTDAEE